ncbi:hypothetical protein ACQ4PT_066834 [Festuca glaucescens]
MLKVILAWSYLTLVFQNRPCFFICTVGKPRCGCNPKTEGAGASVIYAGTVGDLGYAPDLGNYGEYSGAPKEEVLQYARVVLDCVTADPDSRKRALLIGSGIANFSDVGFKREVCLPFGTKNQCDGRDPREARCSRYFFFALCLHQSLS